MLVWQKGFGSDEIWGIEATRSINVELPIVVFAFLFGISMDYQVFIISRMREAYDRTGSTETAVVEGIGRTGRLVTSAALILFLAFVAFSTQPGTEAKIFATALGGGILLDATIIRGVLAPAAVARSSAAGTGGSRTGPRAFSGSNRHLSNRHLSGRQATSPRPLPVPHLRSGSQVPIERSYS